jgi:sphinganine-1-phosphate aldolase
MSALGEDGYVALYRDLWETAQKFRRGVEAVGCRVVSEPVGTLFAYTCPDANIFIVADLMEKKGWFVDRQMAPESIHLTITPAHTPIVDKYLADLRESVEYARAHPELGGEGMAAMYGMVAKLPDPTMITQFLYQYMDERYET